MSRTPRRSLSDWLADGVHRYLDKQVGPNPPLMSCLGYLIPLTPVAAPAPAVDDPRVREWVRCGLTPSQAEALLALDDATGWDTEG